MKQMTWVGHRRCHSALRHNALWISALCELTLRFVASDAAPIAASKHCPEQFAWLNEYR